MILSNTSIHQALDEGRLVIDPEPTPRDPSGGEDCPYQTSAVDLRLGREVSYFREGLALDINLQRGGFARLFGPNSETRQLTEEQPFAAQQTRVGQDA